MLLYPFSYLVQHLLNSSPSTTNLFTVSIRLALSFLFCFLDYTYKVRSWPVFSIWLTSLSIILSRSIHVIKSGIIFLWLSNIYNYICINISIHIYVFLCVYIDLTLYMYIYVSINMCMYVCYMYFHMCIYIVTFVHLSIIEHLGSYHILAIVSYVAINTQCILSL